MSCGYFFVKVFFVWLFYFVRDGIFFVGLFCFVSRFFREGIFS